MITVRSVFYRQIIFFCCQFQENFTETCIKLFEKNKNKKWTFIELQQTPISSLRATSKEKYGAVLYKDKSVQPTRRKESKVALKNKQTKKNPNIKPFALAGSNFWKSFWDYFQTVYTLNSDDPVLNPLSSTRVD